jgi:hypothetical protein
MMKKKLSLLLMMLPGFCMAQSTLVEYRHNLDKLITLNIREQPVSEVLNKMSKAGDFYFSYNGKLFNQDSVVNISMRNKPVRDVLDQLFTGKVDYKEIGEHVILRYAANHFTIEPENITSAERLYLISGYVVDTETGRKVKQASVYEKRLLQSTLTDDEGYFKLRFKGDHTEVILTASKENYRDTSLVFLSDIKVKPEGYEDPDAEKANGLSKRNMAESGLGRFFLSSRQRIQGLNIPDFFANTPFQASLTPGLSSHGSMSSQVINKFSLNVLGGYTAGVNGFEIAGLFNITKGDVKKFQAAGLYNGIGGSVDGFQIAGLANDVRTKVNGVQAAGLINHVREDMDGVQIAGLVNIVSKAVHGTQIAGLGNFSARETEGIQIAGLGNFTSQRMRGMQISGLFNYSKEMNGVQIGLVNINGTSTGYSIGLVNYSRHGYHKLSVYANETINTNVAFKTGNSKLYNIILAGRNFSGSEKIDAFGLGFGHDFLFSNRVSLAAELTSQLIYLGNWDDTNTLARFQTNLQVQVAKGLTVFGGPAYSLYWTEGANGSPGKGYSKQVEPSHHHSFNTHMKGWLGWNVGVTLF